MLARLVSSVTEILPILPFSRISSAKACRILLSVLLEVILSFKIFIVFLV